MKKPIFILSIILFAGSLFAQNWQTIQSDNFNRADGPLGDNYVVNIYPENGIVEIENNRVKLESPESDLYAAIGTPMEETELPFRLSLEFKAQSATNEAYCGYGVMAVAENNYSIGALVFLDTDTIQLVLMDQYMNMNVISANSIDIDDTLQYKVELIVDTESLSMNLVDTEGEILYTLNSAYQDTMTFNNISINTYQSAGELIYFDNLKLENQVVGIRNDSRCNLNDFQIFPNPTKDIIRIDGIESQTVIGIYSITGQLMLETEIKSINQEIDVTQLHNGIYMVKLSHNGQITYKKLIKN